MAAPDTSATPDHLARGATARLLAALGFDVPAPADQPGFRIVEARQDWKQPTANACCHTLTPLRIGARRFARGIGAHANGRIVIELARPYRKFSAFVGVDNNWDTKGRLGSVVFVVKVDGREVARTPVCRGGEPPRWVEVDLTGASRLELIVTDAGDGIAYDQADWADAKLLADDGTVEYVGDALASAVFAFADAPATRFRYDGRLCWDLFEGWQKTSTAPAEIPGGRRYSTTWRSPDGLCATLVATVFDDPPAVELVWHFANDGDAESGLISDLWTVDLRWPSGPLACEVLSSTGGLTGRFHQPREPVGFELQRTWLGRKTLTVLGGRSSNGALPFFLVRDVPAGWGVAVGFGWPGQWRADLAFDEASAAVSVRCGIQPVHFRLPPGAKIRTASAVLVPFLGPVGNGGNRMRRLLRRHYQATLAGKPVEPPVSFNSWFVFHNDVSEELLRQLAEGAARVGVEYFCLDAGWFIGEFPNGVGNWVVDTDKFPGGLRPVADYVHSLGMKFGLWFEPERVTAGTKWWREHPDLILGYRPDDPNARGVLDLARPEARELIVETLSEIISDVGVDWIRYDFNIDPLPLWEAAEDDDHRGLHQVLYINGLYEVLDELMRRHPELLIEQCSSGGRRIDLETLKRGHTYWKSDDTHDQALMRFHETGGNFFLPGGLLNTNLLAFRSVGETVALFAGPLGFGLDFRQLTEDDARELARIVEAYKRVRHLLNADYFALFPQDKTGEMWNGWQFMAPDGSEGFFVVYRPPTSSYTRAEVALQGLDDRADYQLENLLTGEKIHADGARLQRGLTIELQGDAAQAWHIIRARR